MIDPSALITNLIDTLRAIPELVIEMGGLAERIYAYHDQYPKNVSLVHAIHQMPAPSIMAVWQGTAPGSFGGVDVWKHQITLYLRAGETDVGPPSAYYKLFRLITKGEPTVGEPLLEGDLPPRGQPMINTTIHSSCYPMDLPTIQRQTDAEGLDYFEVPITFTEAGDE